MAAFDGQREQDAMASEPAQEPHPDLERERWELLRQLQALLDGPLTALALVWIGLLILDFTTGLSAPLEAVGNVIWAVFLLDFGSRLVLAPRKGEYLRRNWPTALSLLLPALRVLRIFRALRLLRAARAVRSVSLLRLVTSLNRGLRAVHRVLGRRGLGYVAVLTAIVTVTGAAGMAYFESPAALWEAGVASDARGLGSYGEALWWTAMIIATMGSEYWPKTVEGRILAWLLALYAFAIFGYITASIASYFVERDVAAPQRGGEPTAAAETAALRREIAALRAAIVALHSQDGSVVEPPGTRPASTGSHHPEGRARRLSA